MMLDVKLTAAVFALAFISVAAAAQQPHRSNGPLVFIRGNGNVTATGGNVSKHDQTIEMAQQLIKHCPEITMTVKEADPTPDYELVLNREGYGWFDAGDSQFMLLRGSDRTVLYVNKKGTVAKAMKDGCKTLMADWRAHRPQTARGDYWSQQEHAK